MIKEVDIMLDGNNIVNQINHFEQIKNDRFYKYKIKDFTKQEYKEYIELKRRHKPISGTN